MTHSWTEDRNALLAKLWSDGVSASVIGEALHVSADCVRKRAMRMKLPARPATGRHDAWSPANIAKASKLWREGKSASEIARELKVTRNAVIGKMKRLGVTQETKRAASAPRALRAPPVARNPQTGSGHAFHKGKTLEARLADKRKAIKPATQNPFGVTATETEAAARRAKAQAAGLARIEAVNETAANDDAIPLIGRPPGSCAWPVGTPDRPANQMCCGQRVSNGSPYCERHRAVAWTGKVQLSEQAADKLRRAA